MKKNLLIYVEDPRFGGPHQYTICILNELKKNFNIKLTSNKENKIFKKTKSKKGKYQNFTTVIFIVEIR